MCIPPLLLTIALIINLLIISIIIIILMISIIMVRQNYYYPYDINNGPSELSLSWFEETFGKAQWRKVQQMQPMWLCLFSEKQFEYTFENAQWRKAKQMQPMWLCRFRGKQIEETFENALWRKVWGHIVEKSQTNVMTVTMPHRRQAICRDIWRNTMDRMCN